ncbi:MAG: helix-turn-helix transcriptional regulator [Ilumatobacter sp.]|uniref:helix-turn-helix domain-containing protein n=1 Tax=Ilumatobacter sp. TaxID=1967498 RepID=UPI002631CF70|nr:helix-turn-helix transcriptional regulator [Ilumatobacter sp.]MDJ0768998.1 helix-turn-helix transcriptional regulator [Ilumatobacter sp.]
MVRSTAVTAHRSPAADLIVRARRDAGLTQTALAAQLGTTQSVVSRWERGHDEPRLTTLASILQACGLRLSLTVEPDDVDRAQIRQQLEMTPAQRLASVVNVGRAVASARKVG